MTILTKKLLLFHDCREPGTPDPTMAIRSNSDTLKQVSYSLCNVVSGQWTGDEYEWSSVIVAELWLRSRAPGYWEHLLIKTNTNGHSRHTPSPGEKSSGLEQISADWSVAFFSENKRFISTLKSLLLRQKEIISIGLSFEARPANYHKPIIVSAAQDLLPVISIFHIAFSSLCWLLY